jgi:hypothetical protein
VGRDGCAGFHEEGEGGLHSISATFFKETADENCSWDSTVIKITTWPVKHSSH